MNFFVKVINVKSVPFLISTGQVKAWGPWHKVDQLGIDWDYHMFVLSVMTHVQLFVRSVMQTPWCTRCYGVFLVFVPIIGMHLVHKYRWEHWEPFTRHVSRETHSKEE